MAKRRKLDEGEDEDEEEGRRTDEERDLDEDEERDELEDDNFEDDDDEMGGDYNAEQYFDAGDDDADMDAFADGGGGGGDEETFQSTSVKQDTPFLFAAF